MKKTAFRLTAFFLAVLGVLSLAACGNKAPEIDAPAILQSLLEQVQFDSELTPSNTDTSVYFPGLPKDTEITLYTGSGYYADELALLALPTENDASAAKTVVTKHLSELRTQFLSYIPEEVDKIDNAVSRQVGRYLFLCVTSDFVTVNDILNHADDPTYAASGAPAQKPQTDEEPEASVDTPEQPEPEAPAEGPAEEQAFTEAGYPSLQSTSGSYHDYGNGAIRVDDKAYEEYGYSDSCAELYADLINKTAAAISPSTSLYVLPIPTAIGIVLPDDIAENFLNDGDQKSAVESILGKMSDSVIGVNCYGNLMQHRDEYLYFHTDYHWNGRGAYYAYESFCEAKGVEPYTLDQRTEKQFDGFLGVLYWNNSNEDPALGNNPDTVEAFCPVSQSAKMEFTDKNGTTMPWEIISDVSSWNASSKYSTFAGADNPISVFTNPEVTDGSVLVIVKESYGNALLPYLVDHYSTIYEIDYRYWQGNLIDFVNEKQPDDLLFANNLTMIGSNLLIGKLSERFA